MSDDKTQRYLNEIGQLLADEAELPLDGTLLYAKVKEGFVSLAIFKDLGDRVMYRYPDLDLLGDVLLNFWELETSGKRWSELEYVVRDDKFTAYFNYAEDIDPDEDPFDRRDRVVERHFGKKPVVYPDPHAGDDGNTYRL